MRRAPRQRSSRTAGIGAWRRPPHAVVARDPVCPGCGTSRTIDLHMVDRDPPASVGTLMLGMRCSWCPDSAPDAEAAWPICFAAVVRLDESISLLAAEPLHSSSLASLRALKSSADFLVSRSARDCITAITRSLCAGSCRCGAIRISQNALPVLVYRRSRARGARSNGRKP
jgi:hypothetical protein